MKKRILSIFLMLGIAISMFTGVDLGFLKWDGLVSTAYAAGTTGNFRVYYGSTATSNYTDVASLATAFNYILNYNWVKIENNETGSPVYDLGAVAKGYNVPSGKTLILTGKACTYESGHGDADLIQLSGATLYVGKGITLKKFNAYAAVSSASGTNTIYNFGSMNHASSSETIRINSGTTLDYYQWASASFSGSIDNRGGTERTNATLYTLTLTAGSNLTAKYPSSYHATPNAAEGYYAYPNTTTFTVGSVFTADTGYTINNSTTSYTMNTNQSIAGTATIITYSIGYNANSGTGAPASQTKTYGTNLTLTTAKPTRTGYSFSHWNTAAAGNGTTYYSGGTYTANAAATLYAQWTANRYAVTLDAGDGSGGTESVSATYGSAMPTTAVTMPTRDGHTFAGYWSGENGTGTRYYNANGTSQRTWNVAAATTLYAKWVANPTIAINRTAVNERSANDGGVSDTIILTAQNGTFADNTGIIVNNVPAGFTAIVTKIDNTSLMISFSGKAVNHATSNTVNNASITVAAGKITYPLYTGANSTNAAQTTDNFSFVFRDAAAAPNAPVFFGSDGMPGSAWADTVTLDSARLNSMVNITGGTITERGFVYGKVIEVGGEPRIGAAGVTKLQSGSGFGAFSSSVAGLAADSEYIFAAYAITSGGGTYYSGSGTLRPSALCGMGTTSVLPVKDTQATIVGNVLTNGGSAITEVGVVYSTSPNPGVDIGEGQGLSQGKVIFSTIGSQTGSFSVDLSNLDPAGRYYVRTYAINASGVAYGAQVTMSTLDSGLTDTTYLSNLNVDGGTMVPAFNKDVHSYMVSVPSARNNIQVTPYLANTNGASVQISVDGQSWLGVSGTSNKSGKHATITGINGSQINVVYVRVTDKSTGKVRTYILNMMMMPSNSADVINLTLREESEAGTNIALTPAFDMNKTSYTAVVASTIDEVYVEVDKGSNTWITTKIGGVVSDSAENPTKASRVVALSGPSTTITVQTTSQDGKTTKNYTVLIIRQTSSSAYLKNLDVGATSSGTEYNAKLTPVFAPTQTAYGVSVEKDTDEIWFTPSVDAGAEVSVSATSAGGTQLSVTGPDANGSFRVAGLVGGNNTVSIGVTSPDGSTECAYAVTVTKKVSDITKLSNLVIKANTSSTNAASGAAQTLIPSFDPNETAYTVVVENNMAFAHINPTKEDAGASYYFSGSPEYSAATAFSKNTALVLPLSPGSNEIFLHVVAADGSTVNTTVVNIVRKVSSDATLSNIDGVSLSPAFDQDQGVFGAEVEFSVETARITATPTVGTSTISLTVNGVTQETRLAGARTDDVALQSGMNTLIYTVTAQDGVTSRQYAVELIRSASDNAWLEDLSFSPGGIAGGTTYAKAPPSDGNTYESGIDDLGNSYYYYLDEDGDVVVAMEDYSGFDSYTLDYVEAVENDVDHITIKARPKDANATMQYSVDGGQSFEELDADADSSSIPLDVGNNSIIVKVVAQDGETVKEYSLNVVRYGSDDCTLAAADPDNPENGGLWASNLTEPGLDPAYSPETLDYTATAEPRFDKTNVIAKANDANAKIFIKRQKRDESGEQISDVYGEPVVDTLASGVGGPVTAADALLEVGDNVFFIEVVAATGSSQTYTLTITREAPYADLGAAIAPDEVSFPEGLRNEREKTYILNHTSAGVQTITLTPTGDDKPIGPDDGVSYSLGLFSDPDGVLTGKPELDEDGKTLAFAGATGVASGKTATLEIVIHTPNYEDQSVTFYFKTADKTPVGITVNDKKPEDKDYDGDPVPKPGDDDLTIEEAGGADRTDEITGNANSEITYIYEGTDSKGDAYGPTTEPPCDAGDYTLTITIVDEDYEGEEVIEFAIAKKALSITSANHTKAYDSTTAAQGATVSYSGVVPADADEVSVDVVTAAYTLPAAGTKTVNISEVTLVGGKAHNYSVTPQNGYTLTGEGALGITKAPGLTATTPADITIYERLKASKTGSFALGGIELTTPFGVTGARSYAGGTLSNGFNIFTTAGKPAVGGSTLTYTAAAGKAPNLSATQVITITTANFEDITVALTFRTIPRKPLTITADDSNLDKTYNGYAVTPPRIGDLTILDGEDDLSGKFTDDNITYEYHGYDSEGNEYGPSANPPSDAGNYTLTITVEDDERAGELEISFIIKKATPALLLSEVPAVFGETLSDWLAYMQGGSKAKTKIINGEDIPGTFTWTSGNTTPVGNAGTRSHGVTFTPSDTKNYNVVYQNAQVIVAKATPDVSFPTASGASYGDTLADVALTGGAAQHSTNDATPVPGTFAWDAPSTKLDTSKTGKSYAVTFTPEDTDNYNTVSENVVVGTINKAGGLVVSLRDPVLFIKEGANAEVEYSLTSPNIMLSGPVDAPANAKFEVTSVTDTSGIFDGAGGSQPAVGGTTLKYTPDGAQSENDTAEITLKISSDNYSDITVTIQFVVIPLEPAFISGFTPEDGVYNGAEHNGYTADSALVVKDAAGNIITEQFGKDEITYTYTDRDGTTYDSATPPTNAGDYTLTIAVENGTYKGEKEINFSIAKAMPNVQWPEDLSATYGDTLAKVKLGTNAGDTRGTFTWTAGDTTSVGVAGQRQHNVTFTPSDSDNYEILSQDVPIAVAKADPDVTWPTDLSGTYGDTLGSVELPAGGSATSAGGAELPGTFTWDAPSKLLVTGSPVPTYAITFTPSDAANYNTAQTTVPVSAGKASGLLKAVPDVLEINIKLFATDAAQFNMANAVALSRKDTGAVSYALGALGGDAIFGSNPSINGTSGVLSYTPSGTKTAGQTAMQIVTISTENYSDVTVRVVFTVLPKTHIEIEGITPEDGVYNGGEHDGYDGTIAVVSQDDGQDKFAELEAAGAIEYIYKDDAGTGLPNPPTTPGDYTLTIKVADDNEDFEGEKTISFTVDKAAASALGVDPGSITIKIREAADSAASYNIKGNVALTPPDGCITGDVSYALGTLSGDGIFSTDPAIGAATGLLSYTPAANKTEGQGAEQIIKITTDHYEDVFVTVVFEVIPKTAVTIGGLEAKNGQYDSANPSAKHEGFDDDALSITSNGEDGEDLTSELSGELEYIYNGRNDTEYGPDSATPPTLPGDYTVTIRIPGSNIDYESDAVEIDFVVAKESSPGAPTLTGDAVSSYGGNDGKITITDDDSNLNYDYEYSNDGGVSWIDASVNSDGEIEDLPAGEYAVRVKESATTEAGESATVAITQPRGITLTISKNGQPWTTHGTELGETFTLKGSDDTPISASATSTGASVHFNVAADGEYAVYADSVDTGLTVTLADSDTFATEAVHYYSVSFAADSSGLPGDFVVTYNGDPISSGAIVLGGGALVVTVEGTDSATDVYTYTWTGAGTTAASGDTLSISTLGEKVDATCAIAGINAGITVSFEGIGGLKYGDTVDGKAIFTLADENGTFEYAGSTPTTLSIVLDGIWPEVGGETTQNAEGTEPGANNGDTDPNPDEEASTPNGPGGEVPEPGAGTNAATLSMETFAANTITYQLDPSDFAISGLDSTGLEAGTATRISDTVVEVSITGTISSMGTITLTAPSSVDKENVVHAQNAVPITSSTTLTLEVGKASQSAPSVTANENHETDAHSIGNIDSTMEYSTDGGQTWVSYDGSNPPDLTGDVEIWVRYKETSTHEASPPTVLTFHEKGTLGGTASITGTPTAGYPLTIDTSQITGNANRSTLRYQWQRDGADISGATSATYVASAADVDKTITCVVTSTAEYGAVTAPGVVIAAGNRDYIEGQVTESEDPEASFPPESPSKPSEKPPRPAEKPAQGNDEGEEKDGDAGLPDAPATTEAEPTLVSETIKETTAYGFGSGSITVTIVKDDGQTSVVALVDTKAAIETILSPEELARVAAGEHAEIRVHIRHLAGEANELSAADKSSIENAIASFASQIDGLSLGKYLGIAMQYRIGSGEWIPVAETREEIALAIDIPGDILEVGSKYFVVQCHEGRTALLHDLDETHETITIATKLFSACAIAHTVQNLPAIEEEAAERACWLCGACPEPLGICLYIWLLILLAAGVAVYLIVKNRKKKEAEDVSALEENK